MKICGKIIFASISEALPYGSYGDCIHQRPKFLLRIEHNIDEHAVSPPRDALTRSNNPISDELMLSVILAVSYAYAISSNSQAHPVMYHAFFCILVGYGVLSFHWSISNLGPGNSPYLCDE
jgi:hypothetical protein